MIPRIRALWRNLVHGDRAERDLDDEVRAAHELLIAEKVAAGLSSAEARRAAAIELGGVEQVKEQVRQIRAGFVVESIWKDLRYAARNLRRSPGFAVAAVLALGVGIGANNTLFTIVNAACIRGLDIFEPHRVMFIGSRDSRGTERGLSYRDFEDLRAGTQAFVGLAAHAAAPLSIAEEGRAPDRVFGNYVSASVFELLGETLLLGRDFQSADDRPGAAAVVMLGHAVWRTRYDSDPTVIGRTVRINGIPSTVLGVMRDRFKLPNNADVWLPLSQMPGVAAQGRDVRTLAVFGRLAPGVSAAQAEDELKAITTRLARDYPETNADIQSVVVPINERYNQDINLFITFLTVGGIIVLIACGNVANLLLMRSVQRLREIAMRASLGATRWRVVRQLLVESTLLATLGGIAGLGFSIAGLSLLWNAIPANAVPYWSDYRMDGRVMAVLASVCLGAVFLFGLVPAVHLAKTDVMEVLKSGGRFGTGGFRSRKWTTVFLTTQFGLMTVFLAAAVNGERISRVVRRAEFSIDVSPLLTMWISLPAQKYRTPDERAAFYERLGARLDSMAAVSSSAMTSALPFGGAVTRQLAIDGHAATAGPALPTVWTIAVGPRYFETIGLPIRGRELTQADGTSGPDVVDAIVNQRLASLYFPNEDPVGRELRLSAATAPTTTATIVGVSATLRQRAAGGPEADPLVYLPLRATMPATAALIVRLRSDAGVISSLLREEVRALDPDLPIYRMMSMEQAVSDARWGGTQSMWILYTLLSIAFGLAIVGLYALTAHAVAVHTRELGVRIALGAQRGGVMRLVLGRMLRQLAIGLAAGIVCTLAWERAFNSVTPPTPGIAATFRMTDPIVLVFAEALIVVVALAACLSLARRATRLDPVVALRHE